jgi:hypothetical protein
MLIRIEQWGTYNEYAVEVEQLGLKLIQEYVPYVSTTEQRFGDKLDFHEVHIKSLVSLVEKAYIEGRNYAANSQHWDIVPKTRSLEYGDIEL